MIVDTSSRLQLCIELYRDDLHLAPFHISGFQKIQQHDQYQLDSDGRNIKVHDILASQLQHRQRWESFNPRMVGRITSGFNDWFYYEFNNGCLAYSEENDTIIFQDPRNNASDDYPAKTLKLPFPTADFTFDLSQDLLVVLNAAYAFVVTLSPSSNRSFCLPQPTGNFLFISSVLLLAQRTLAQADR